MTRLQQLVGLLDGKSMSRAEIETHFPIGRERVRTLIYQAKLDWLVFVSARGNGFLGWRYTSSRHLALPVQPERKQQPKPLVKLPSGDAIVKSALSNRAFVETIWNKGNV